MAIPLIVPIAGAAAVGGLLLRLRAVAKAKQKLGAGASPVQQATGKSPLGFAIPPIPSVPIVTLTPAPVALPDGRVVPAIGGVPIGVNPPAPPSDVEMAAGELGVSVADLTAAAQAIGLSAATLVATNDTALMLSALSRLQSGGAPAASSGSQKAIVTTNDPPPSGDLIIRSAPSASAPQIGGAEKNGTVTILNGDASPDGLFAEIQWDGGSRHPASRGFARKAFLKLI